MLQKWDKTKFLGTAASTGPIVPAPNDRCVWNTVGKTTGKEKQKLPKKNVLYKSHIDCPAFEHWHSQSEAFVMAQEQLYNKQVSIKTANFLPNNKTKSFQTLCC